MAPERFSMGGPTRSDVYEQQIAGHLVTPPPRPSLCRPGVPPALDDVVAAGMAKDVGARFASPIALADAARAALRRPLGPTIAHGGVQGETFIAAPGGPVSPSASTQYGFALSHPPGPPDVVQQQGNAPSHGGVGTRSRSPPLAPCSSQLSPYRASSGRRIGRRPRAVRRCFPPRTSMPSSVRAI